MTTENDDRVLDSDSDKIPATLVPSSDVTSKCGLCHRGHISHPLAAGKLYRISGSLTHVHYFCMLFSAYAKQIGGKRLVFNHKCHSLDETIHLPQWATLILTKSLNFLALNIWLSLWRGRNNHLQLLTIFSILEDDEGLFGFYGSEVVKQIDLARKKKCLYCSLTGATARCATKRCTVTMHFQCGIERGATFQFHTKNMYVFCVKV